MFHAQQHHQENAGAEPGTAGGLSSGREGAPGRPRRPRGSGRPRRLVRAGGAAVTVIAAAGAMVAAGIMAAAGPASASTASASTASASTASASAAGRPAALTPPPVVSVDSNLFASVSQSGTLVTGTPGTSVTHLGTGQYEVTFPRNVASCSYVATTINAYSQALQAYTAGGHLSSDGVYVETKNQGGGLTAGPFNLVVDCGQPGWSYAVVGYTANLVRATSGTTLTALGTGRYDVTFPASVQNCAYLASVGDPGNALVYNPAGVYTGSASNPDAVYIETKNPAGGLTSGIPFHLAVLCPAAADTSFAVVNAAGLLARGSALTSSYSSGTGQYTLITSGALTQCAEVASRGSVDTSAPVTPATVEIVPGPGSNTAGLQVRDLLYFGGGLDSQSFQVAAVC